MKSILILCQALIICLFASPAYADESPALYILYLCPEGELGQQIKHYWHEMQENEDINHKAISFYPPHCTLTRFFQTALTKEQLEQALKETMSELHQQDKTITIHSLTLGERRDYIRLESRFLEKLARVFLSKIKVDSRWLKSPKQFPYHIALRDYNFSHRKKKQLEVVHELQEEINLNSEASWSIAIYTRKADQMELVTSIKL